MIEVQVHFDARCQTVLEQIREAEMVQAIDRVRPVFNRRKIFVLNNLPLDLTVDRALTWPELRPGNFASLRPLWRAAAFSARSSRVFTTYGRPRVQKSPRWRQKTREKPK